MDKSESYKFWHALMVFPMLGSFFLLMPLTIYFFQPSEFSSSAGMIFLIGTLLTIAVGLPIAILCGLIKPLRSASFWAAGIIMTFVVASCLIFPVSTGELVGGSRVAAREITAWDVGEFLLRASVLGGLVFLSFKRQDQLRPLFPISIGIGAVFICFVLFFGGLSSESESDAVTVPKADFSSISGEGDIIVVLLDELRGTLVKDLLQSRPELESEFSGFRFFTEATSASPRTAMSLPNIFSGEYYSGGPAGDWMARATAEDSFLKDGQAAGYESRYLQTMGAPCGTIPCIKATSFSDASASQVHISDYETLFQYGALRVTPKIIHPHLDARKLISSLTKLSAKFLSPESETVTKIGPAEMFSRSFENYIDRIVVRKDIKKPRLIFAHFTHTHLPVDFRADCEFADELGTHPDNVMGEVECGISQLIDLNRHLKSIGAYDETTLIYISDHGENTLYNHSPLPSSEFAYVPGEEEHFRPIIFIKPPQANGSIQYSHAPAALVDVRQTVCGFMEECDQELNGHDLRLMGDDDVVTRRIMHFRYGSGLEDKDGVYPDDVYRFVDFEGRISNLAEAIFEPAQYEIGDEILFSSEGNGKLYTFSGWSMPQSRATFFDARSGKSAKLSLMLNEPVNRTLKMTVEGDGYTGSMNVAVRVNGVLVDTWEVIASRGTDVGVFEIPEVVTAGANRLNIEFEPDFTASPSSKNPDSNDLRELSVYLYSLKLE